jgi:hypothetical protein
VNSIQRYISSIRFIFLSIQHLQRAKPLHMNSTFVVIDENLLGILLESESYSAAAAASTASCAAVASLTGSALPPGSCSLLSSGLPSSSCLEKSPHVHGKTALVTHWWNFVVRVVAKISSTRRYLRNHWKMGGADVSEMGSCGRSIRVL